MKMFKYILWSLLSVLLISSCSDDDDKKEGHPTMDIKGEFSNAMFGDSLPFVINVSDDVPLSTLKARVYYGDQMMSEVVIRTKTEGEYSGKIYIPFLKDIPNGNASLEFVLQNIHFTISNKTYDLAVTRPVYPHLTFVTPDKEYKMLHTDGYNYEFTDVLPQKTQGYIKTPIITPNGNEITFGWENNAITQGSTETITFSDLKAGEYTIAFNIFDYTAAPFLVPYAINGNVLEKIDENNYKTDLALTQGQEIIVNEIDGFNKWWIDPDFFRKDGDKLFFTPISGNYRISADFKLKYLKVEVLSGTSTASLNPDGSGAIWIIGDAQGKPVLANNGWDPNKALCLAPIGPGKYQISFIAGETIGVDKANFGIFYGKGWTTSFKPETITVNSPLFRIGTKTNTDPGNGVDNGNIVLEEGKTLTKGKAYVFVVDVSGGLDKATLTVTEK